MITQEILDAMERFIPVEYFMDEEWHSWIYSNTQCNWKIFITNNWRIKPILKEKVKVKRAKALANDRDNIPFESVQFFKSIDECSDYCIKNNWILIKFPFGEWVECDD